jgi:hypothetical protein
MTKKYEKIIAVNACDFPNEVIDYCVDNEINTHYDNDLVNIDDDGNPLAEWLKEIGVDFKGKDSISVGIWST